MSRNFATAGSDYATATSTPIQAAPLTIAGWINITSGALAIASIGVSESWNGWYLYLEGGGTDLSANTVENASFTKATKTGTFSWGTWYHVGGVFASASSRIAYVDGSGSTEDTTTKTPSGTIDRVRLAGLMFAGQHAGGAHLSAEWGIWNVALSADEMLALARRYSPELIRPESLVHYWRVGGRYSPETSLVGTEVLTLSGTPAVAAHPPIIYPHRRAIRRFGTAAAGASATISATESTDTTAIAAAATTPASIAAIESSDIGSIVATVTTGAALAASESSDAAAVTAANWTTAQLAATDGSDSASIGVTVTTGVTLAAVESADSATVTAANWTTAQVAASDSSDIAALSVEITTGATLAVTDSSDSAQIEASAGGASASIAAIEASDIAALSSEVTTGAALAATDASDTAIVTGAPLMTVQIATTENGDSAVIAATITTGAGIVASEASDLTAILASANLVASIAATDSSDIVVISALNWTTAQIDADESSDTASIFSAGYGLPSRRGVSIDHLAARSNEATGRRPAQTSRGRRA